MVIKNAGEEAQHLQDGLSAVGAFVRTLITPRAPA